MALGSSNRRRGESRRSRAEPPGNPSNRRAIQPGLRVSGEYELPRALLRGILRRAHSFQVFNKFAFTYNNAMESIEEISYMSSCPRCGARNNANLDACRLCGTFLGIERDASSSIEKIDTNSPTVVVPVADAAKQAGKGPEVIDPSGAGQGFLECPICHTANEVGWAFCPNCGKQNIINNSYCSGCGGAIPAAETVAMASVSAPPKGRLRLIMEGGQEGDFFELKEDTVVGRTSGDIAFPHDGFMSGRHARIIRRGSSFILKDEGSRNGTFVKIRGEVELRPGDVVLIGKQLFKFEL